MKTLKENSNAPAFPTDVLEHEYPFGLTKREYFASLAMQATISACGCGETGVDYGKVSIASVEAADALLKTLCSDNSEAKIV